VLSELLDRIRDLRILVIGEAIEDVYHFVTPLGISQKDAIVTWQESHSEAYDGGALACANHLNDFSKSVGLLVNSNRLVKERFVLQPFGTKVFALEWLTLADEDLATVRDNLRLAVNYDVVLVADYGHGLIDTIMCDKLVVALDVPFLAVMAQSNSGNFGFNPVTRYRGADYVCVDEVELRLAMQDRTSPLEVLVGPFREQMDAAMVAITRGPLGCLVVDGKGSTEVPAIAGPVVDRLGAGDAFFALTAPCAALGASRETIGRIGNAAGALAVRAMGNSVAVTREALEGLLR